MAKFADELSCKTKLETETSSFKIIWHVHREVVNKLFQDKEYKTQSAPLETSFCNSSWFLKLKLNKNTSNDISLYLLKKKCSKKVWVKFDYILKAKNNEKDKESYDDEWHNDYMDDVGRGYNTFLSKPECDADTYWHDNYLIIICKAQLKTIETQLATTSNLGMLETKKNLENDISNLLQTGLLSDVTFDVAGKRFKVHRNILSARCEYFKAMFTSGLKESTDSEIEIQDIEPHVFEIILQFIYTEKLPDNLESVAKDLLVGADKYQLQELVKICENHLTQKITMENCAELLVFSDLYRQNRLKQMVIAFIKANLKDVFQSEAWKELKVVNSKLAFEVIEATVV